MERGEKAEKILNDELVQEAFARCEQWITDQFKNAPARDHEGVLELHRLWKTATRFRRFFEEAVNGGKSAEQHLEEKRKGVSFLGDVWPSRRPR